MLKRMEESKMEKGGQENISCPKKEYLRTKVKKEYKPFKKF